MRCIVACDGGDKARLSGETTKEAVKTIARGMPDVSGATVVDLLGVLFSFAPEAAGAASARHSLRPQFSEGQGSAITRAHLRRGNAAMRQITVIPGRTLARATMCSCTSENPCLPASSRRDGFRACASRRIPE